MPRYVSEISEVRKSVLEPLLPDYSLNMPKLNKEENLVLSIALLMVIRNLELKNVKSILLDRIEEKFRNTFNYQARLETEILIDRMVDPSCYDVLGRLYEEYIHRNNTRKRTGQFYSPQEVVNYMVESIKLRDEEEIKEKRFIDIACGTGVFLTAFAKNIISRSQKKESVPNLITSNIYGLDINPIACLISKINLFILMLNELGPDLVCECDKLKFQIYCSNAIENRPELFSKNEEREAEKIKSRHGKYEGGFDYILGNPPYLEAKKMPQGLKKICKSNFPVINFGAFDLYISFIGQCNRLVSDGGLISLILPNKFTVAKYGIKLREQLLNRFKLLEIVDLSGMDIFHKADVYPIVLTYENVPPGKKHCVKTVMSLNNFRQLKASEKAVRIQQTVFESIGRMKTIFCLPSKKDFVNSFRRIFDEGKSIDHYLQFRTTVSFHKKGLRENFVKKEFDNTLDRSLVRKYLGGISYSKKNEVSKFKIEWNGYYIYYDQNKLGKIKNPIPPLSNFEREKIIFCQHAREITATYDKNGEWVTKDVYPIAYSKLSIGDLSLKYFCGVLNSKLLSFIYGIVYKGIQIGGSYYHYLPTWMEILPIVLPTSEQEREMGRLVDYALSAKNEVDVSFVLLKINELTYKIYRIKPDEQAIIESFFDLS